MGSTSSSSNAASKIPNQLVVLQNRFQSADQLSKIANEFFELISGSGFSQSSTYEALLESKKIMNGSGVPEDHEMATLLNGAHNPFPDEIWLKVFEYTEDKTKANLGASCIYLRQIYHTFCQGKVGRKKDAIMLWNAQAFSSYSFSKGGFLLINGGQTVAPGADHLLHEVTNDGVQIVNLAGEERVIPSLEPIFFETSPQWVSRANNGGIQVWDSSQPNEPVRQIEAEQGELQAITSDDGEEFLLLSHANLATIWRIATWEKIGPVAAISSPYRLIRHGDGLFLFSRNNNQTRVIECGAPTKFLDLPFDSINLFTLSKELLNYSVVGTQLRVHNALTGLQVWQKEITQGALSRHFVEIDDHPHLALQYENQFQILNLASGLEFAQFQNNGTARFLHNGKDPILLTENGESSRVWKINSDENHQYEATGLWIRTLTAAPNNKGRVHALLYRFGLLFPNEGAFVTIPQISNRHLYSPLFWKGTPAVASLSKRPNRGSYSLTIYNAQETEQIQLSRVAADWETTLRGRPEKISALKIVTLNDLTLAIARCQITLSNLGIRWGLYVWNLDTREVVGRLEIQDYISLDEVQVRRSTKYRYEIDLGQGGRLFPILEEEKSNHLPDSVAPSGLKKRKIRFTELLILFGMFTLWRASRKVNRWLSPPTAAPQ